MEELVWYVSYGSNMCADRLACYLRGGRPEGGLRAYPGARDTTAPEARAATTLPGRIYFAGRSRTWRGGMAFYDPRRPGPTPARAYLLTIEQFADLAAQECDRDPAPDGPVEAALRDRALLTAPGAATDAGDGPYSRLLRVGTRDGIRALTFTAPDGLAAAPRTAPSAPYLAMIGRGLREGHALSDDAIADYFAALI